MSSTIRPSACSSFDLLDLQQYTQEKAYSNTASRDFHLFYVGRDDVHDILKHVLSRVSVSLYLNMFGYDDEELNDILMKIALDPTVTMLVTLDKSQAGGEHEAALLDADKKHDLALFNTHFVTKTHVQEFSIGQSATHQISHTKGFVADGRVGGEGSTNWSDSGEAPSSSRDSPGAPATRRRTTRSRSSPTPIRSAASPRNWSPNTWWPRNRRGRPAPRIMPARPSPRRRRRIPDWCVIGRMRAGEPL